MKKVYDRRILVKVDGWKEFEDTSIFRCLQYEDEELASQEFLYRFKTFEEMKAKIEECGWLLNAKITTTFFTKQPKIKISTANSLFGYSSTVVMTKKNFKPIEVKIVCNEENNLSIKTLADLLDADSFCEYLRDRNISSLKI